MRNPILTWKIERARERRFAAYSAQVKIQLRENGLKPLPQDDSIIESYFSQQRTVGDCVLEVLIAANYEESL